MRPAAASRPRPPRWCGSVVTADTADGIWTTPFGGRRAGRLRAQGAPVLRKPGQRQRRVQIGDAGKVAWVDDGRRDTEVGQLRVRRKIAGPITEIKALDVASKSLNR